MVYLAGRPITNSLPIMTSISTYSAIFTVVRRTNRRRVTVSICRLAGSGEITFTVSRCHNTLLRLAMSSIAF